MSGAASRLRLPAAMLMFALCVHNVEEALTFKRYRESSSSLLAGMLGRQITIPTVSAFHEMLVAVTIAGLAIALWAGSGIEGAAKARALTLFAWLLLANILLPHVPAAMAMGGYAPGVLTAIGINLPVAVFCLRRLSMRRVQRGLAPRRAKTIT